MLKLPHLEKLHIVVKVMLYVQLTQPALMQVLEDNLSHTCLLYLYVLTNQTRSMCYLLKNNDKANLDFCVYFLSKRK